MFLLPTSCFGYVHTICQVNKDTTQCRIVVTVWREKFSRLRWFSLCELNKSLGISQRWWQKTWRFCWLKDVYPSSLFTELLFLAWEKKAVTAFLWSSKGIVVDDRWNLYHTVSVIKDVVTGLQICRSTELYAIGCYRRILTLELLEIH